MPMYRGRLWDCKGKKTYSARTPEWNVNVMYTKKCVALNLMVTSEVKSLVAFRKTVIEPGSELETIDFGTVTLEKPTVSVGPLKVTISV